MLRKETVDNTTLELIKNLQEKSYLKDFLLVGGTGLALQIGHRKSIDIDLFTDRDFDSQSILENLENDFSFSLDQQGSNTLKGAISDVKVDILAHKYHAVASYIEIENIRMASKQDVMAMKLNAISGDGTRAKDFIDIYYLLKEFSVTNALEFYQTKYTQRNPMHVLKSMNYFEDVSLEDWPDMILDKNLTWATIKSYINQKVTEYTRLLVKDSQIKTVKDIISPKSTKKGKGFGMTL